MKKFLKNPILKFFVFVYLFTLIGTYAEKKTDGFTVWGISSFRDFDPRWETRTLSWEEEKELLRAISQPYVYLAKGAQAFVFQSQDQQYVIKFFKQRLFTPSRFLNMMPLPSWLERYRFKRNWKRLDKFKRDFESYQMAFEELQTETGVVYVHLNHTKYLNTQLKITDKIGISHEIDLDHFDFIIQKKAERVYERITRLMKAGDIQGSCASIHQVFELIVHRCKKGYKDRDPSIETNCGFINDAAIKIDVGRLERSEQMKNPLFYRKELLLIIEPFKEWVAYFYPHLIPEFERTLQQVLHNE